MARKIQKQHGKQLLAYELGKRSEMEMWLISQGKITREGDTYYLRSTEVVNSDPTGKAKGQKAKVGDFFKVDGEENPYPNEREWFLENHRIVNPEANIWEQMPKPLEAWAVGDEFTDAMQFAVDNGLITLNDQDLQHYFKAFLWGEWLTAPCDATVVFYSVTREDGVVTKIDFNFVIKSEVESNYVVIDG